MDSFFISSTKLITCYYDYMSISPEGEKLSMISGVILFLILCFITMGLYFVLEI